MLFAWIAVGLLVVSLVAPISQAPFVGSLNLFSLQDGTAYWFVGFAIAAAVATFAKYFRLLIIPGVLVIGMTLLYAYHLEQTKAELVGAMQGNIFSGLASAASASIHLQWGIALLIVAGVALVVAGIMRSDADTLPELFAANRMQFIEGGIALAVLFVGIMLLPHVVPQSAKSASASTPGPDPFAAAGSSTANDATPSPDPRIARLRQAVSVGLLEKGFRKANYDQGTFSDAFTAKIQYHNLTDKKVVGIKGALRFVDQFGKEFAGFSVEYQRDIPPHGIAVEETSYDYNQFEAKDAKLRDTPLSRLKVVWHPTRINYADGSSNSAPED